MNPRGLSCLRRLCLALPQAHEVEAWGEPTFRVGSRLFAMYAAAGNHHGNGRAAVWCKAAPGNQQFMIRAAPDRFFVPPYVGPSGWVGVWLDAGTDWAELAGLLADGWALVAPKRLTARTAARPQPAGPALGSGPPARGSSRPRPSRR